MELEDVEFNYTGGKRSRKGDNLRILFAIGCLKIKWVINCHVNLVNYDAKLDVKLLFLSEEDMDCAVLCAGWLCWNLLFLSVKMFFEYYDKNESYQLGIN